MSKCEKPTWLNGVLSFTFVWRLQSKGLGARGSELSIIRVAVITILLKATNTGSYRISRKSPRQNGACALQLGVSTVRSLSRCYCVFWTYMFETLCKVCSQYLYGATATLQLLLNISFRHTSVQSVFFFCFSPRSVMMPSLHLVYSLSPGVGVSKTQHVALGFIKRMDPSKARSVARAVHSCKITWHGPVSAKSSV